MNPFNLPPQNRLTIWRQFRCAIQNNPEDEQINKVAEFWGQCPFIGWTIEPTDPASWCSVWEMLFDGRYCLNSTAVAIESTLRFLGFDANRLELSMIRKVDAFRSEYFIVKIDGNQVLNYHDGVSVPVDSLPDGIEQLYSYQWKDNKYTKI